MDVERKPRHRLQFLGMLFKHARIRQAADGAPAHPTPCVHHARSSATRFVRRLLIKAALPLQHLHQIACPLFHTVILSLQLILKVITADPLQHIINILK